MVGDRLGLHGPVPLLAISRVAIKASAGPTSMVEPARIEQGRSSNYTLGSVIDGKERIEKRVFDLFNEQAAVELRRKH